MSNHYPYCGDRPLDPPDDTENELAFDAACEAAWVEYLDSGSLPDGRDAGDVDELLSELGILDDLLTAKNDDDLLDAAKAIRDARQEIVDGIIRDSVSI
jgi:hypothetical protein